MVIFYKEADPHASFYTESMCLQEGEYKFSIYDSGCDGICCYWGDYGNDVLLVEEGGEFV